jgi:sec-independent protein translocase protein TatC
MELNKDFASHIADLRKGLLVIVGSIIFFSIIASFFNDWLIYYFKKPLGDHPLVFLSPIEPFTFIIKLDVIVGLVLSIPVIFFVTWWFFSPALNSTEKKAALVYVFFVSLFAVAAFYYTYLYLLPVSIKFLLSYNYGMQFMISVEKYFSFFLFMIVSLILVFQIPFVIHLLVRTGLVSRKQLSTKRKYIYVGLTIFLAVLTPTTDAFTLVVVAVPAFLLFELGLITTLFIKNKGEKNERKN